MDHFFETRFLPTWLALLMKYSHGAVALGQKMTHMAFSKWIKASRPRKKFYKGRPSSQQLLEEAARCRSMLLLFLLAEVSFIEAQFDKKFYLCNLPTVFVNKILSGPVGSVECDPRLLWPSGCPKFIRFFTTETLISVTTARNEYFTTSSCWEVAN